MTPNLLVSRNPATGAILWSGSCADANDVRAAVSLAEEAFQGWSRTSHGEREALLRRFAEVLKARKEVLAELISAEIGKPRWEALTEVQSMIGKIPLVIEAHQKRCSDFSGGPAITRFRPHGVVAVFGPYNFPGHLPNGHIAPALLAGNTIVFKPSEEAPAVADFVRSCWREAGLPEGALVVIQGDRITGEQLVRDRRVRGIFFTGGTKAGRAIEEASRSVPGRILALEMGGNNPLVVWPPLDEEVAALLAVQSAFLSSGQRCTCARRLILPDGASGALFLNRLVRLASGLRVGAPTERPEPFMGSLVSPKAAAAVLRAHEDLVARGCRVLLESRRLGEALVTPGIIDVSGVQDLPDEEIFGPLLRVVRVANFDEALREANATRFGLAAGLLGGDAELYSKFRYTVRAGIINWNQQLTGASGAAPFGGVGDSGNHRPSGFFAADYCSYPVAGMENAELVAPRELPPGLLT
jgi:succinylglutamic semialdehyde dehydrogenase